MNITWHRACYPDGISRNTTLETHYSNVPGGILVRSTINKESEGFVAVSMVFVPDIPKTSTKESQ